MRSILIVNYEYPPVGGGASNASYCLAREMAASGNRVAVITMAFEHLRGYFREDNVAVYRIAALRKKAGEASLLQMGLFVVGAIISLSAAVKREKPECGIIFFGLPCGIIGLVLKTVFNLPYIVMLRGGDVPGFEPSMINLHRLLQPLRKKIYAKSAGVIANSNALAALGRKADPEVMVQVITNGVDCSFYRPVETVSHGNSVRFLFAGRMVKQKNIQVLLTAFGGCCDENKTCQLMLIGEGPLRRQLEAETEMSSIKERIIWKEWLSKKELLHHLQQSDCFVIPSVIEGMSNALLEAMACGLAVIAGNCAGNSELVTDGKNGYLIDPENTDELRDAMMEVINNRKRAKQCGVNARIDCLQKHSWAQKTVELLQVIEYALQKRGYDR